MKSGLKLLLLQGGSMNFQLFCLLIATFCIGCVSPQTERGYLNDPRMELQPGGGLNSSSPLTNLTNRSESSGGQSCSVCAH